MATLHFPHSFDPLVRIFREHEDQRVKEVALESLGKLWLAGVRVDPGTLADYRMHVEKRLIPEFENRRVQSLTPLAIDVLLRKQGRPDGD